MADLFSFCTFATASPVEYTHKFLYVYSKNQFFFPLRNGGVLSLRGTVEVFFNQFGPFSITIFMKELLMCLLNVKAMTSFFRPGKCL